MRVNWGKGLGLIFWSISTNLWRQFWDFKKLFTSTVGNTIRCDGYNEYFHTYRLQLGYNWDLPLIQVKFGSIDIEVMHDCPSGFFMFSWMGLKL